MSLFLKTHQLTYSQTNIAFLSLSYWIYEFVF